VLGRAGGAGRRARVSVPGPKSRGAWDRRHGLVRSLRVSSGSGKALRHFLGVGCSLLLVLGGCRPRGLERQPKTILAVFAHPDDEIFVGPLLSHYVRRGARVRLAIVTDGEKGASPRAGVPAGPELIWDDRSSPNRLRHFFDSIP
jgi:hypothetical protein